MLTNSFQPRINNQKYIQSKNVMNNKSAIQHYKQHQTNPPKMKRKSSVGSNKNSHCCIPKKGEQNSSRADNRHHTRKRSEVPSTKYSSIIIEDNTINCNNEENKNNSSRKNNNFFYDNDKTQNEKYLKVIQMLMYYIKMINTHLGNIVNKHLYKKNNIIKELQYKNEFLIKENTELKKKIIGFYYISKQFDLNEREYKNKMNMCLNDLYNENIYLRKANLSTASISMELINKYNKHVKEKLNRKTSIKEEQKDDNVINNENNPFQCYNDEQNDNPFTRSNSNEEQISRIKHKRQRTHINLNDMNSDESNGMVSFISNLSNEDKKDAFGQTMNSLGFMNKTMKRNDGSRKNVLEELKDINNGISNKIGSNRGYTSPNSSQSWSGNKKTQLFYRTPRGKEKNVIEFKK